MKVESVNAIVRCRNLKDFKARQHRLLLRLRRRRKAMARKTPSGKER